MFLLTISDEFPLEWRMMVREQFGEPGGQPDSWLQGETPDRKCRCRMRNTDLSHGSSRQGALKQNIRLEVAQGEKSCLREVG